MGKIDFETPNVETWRTPLGTVLCVLSIILAIGAFFFEFEHIYIKLLVVLGFSALAVFGYWLVKVDGKAQERSNKINDRFHPDEGDE